MDRPVWNPVIQAPENQPSARKKAIGMAHVVGSRVAVGGIQNNSLSRPSRVRTGFGRVPTRDSRPSFMRKRSWMDMSWMGFAWLPCSPRKERALVLFDVRLSPLLLGCFGVGRGFRALVPGFSSGPTVGPWRCLTPATSRLRFNLAVDMQRVKRGIKRWLTPHLLVSEFGRPTPPHH
jgi:hypothetical protein